MAIAILHISEVAAQISGTFLREEKSNAILITSDTEFVIKSRKESVYKKSYRLIVKNAFAKDLANIAIYYDQFRKVKKATAVVKNLNGREIYSYKLKDFTDEAAGLSDVASDGRIKYLNINHQQYPFEIEVSYEVENKGSLYFPKWSPQESKVRVLSASFRVVDEMGDNLRFKAHQVSPAKINETKQGKSYFWAIKDIEPFEYEYFNHIEQDYTPIVYTAPATFEMKNYVGDMTSWQNFGNWIKDLNENRNDLKDTDLQVLDEAVTKATNKLEKTKIVYDYLQEHTRYVSIQLGLGGWQPFKTAFVHENKYGDCKALSYYTKSLLERYDIKSYYTLIRAGKHKATIDESFPQNSFNHAILSVPFEQDTVFLECTSQTNPFAYMGTFTGNRKALLITENGGKLINTRYYSIADNQQNSYIVVKLAADGAAKVGIKRTYSGLEIENYDFDHLYRAETKNVNHWLLDNYRWQNTNQDAFELLQLQEGVVPKCGFKANLSSGKEATKMGKRLFIAANKYIDSHLPKLTTKERKTPIHIKYGYQQSDTIVYVVPEKMQVEKSVTPVVLETKYGKYERKVLEEADKLILCRHFAFYDGVYEASEYKAFREFVTAVLKHDTDKVVLVEE